MGGTYNDIDLENPPVFEIDESLFSHVDGQQIWVFGIITRITNESRCWVVPDRSAQTLIPIIQEHLPPGSIVYSDGWASYRFLSTLGYQHRVLRVFGLIFSIDEIFFLPTKCRNCQRFTSPKTIFELSLKTLKNFIENISLFKKKTAKVAIDKLILSIQGWQDKNSVRFCL